jgi:hypothetical protein
MTRMRFFRNFATASQVKSVTGSLRISGTNLLRVCWFETHRDFFKNLFLTPSFRSPLVEVSSLSPSKPCTKHNITESFTLWHFRRRGTFSRTGSILTGRKTVKLTGSRHLSGVRTRFQMIWLTSDGDPLSTPTTLISTFWHMAVAGRVANTAATPRRPRRLTESSTNGTRRQADLAVPSGSTAAAGTAAANSTKTR